MRIAIPKGRLQERALGVFEAAGFGVPAEADLKTRSASSCRRPLGMAMRRQLISRAPRW